MSDHRAYSGWPPPKAEQPKPEKKRAEKKPEGDSE